MMLVLSFLGTCEASWRGESIHFASNTARALLSYLAAHPNQPQTREHLAALLYPEHTQANAFINLRSTLARLRKAIPDESQALTVTAYAITFHQESAQVDVIAFEGLLAECAAHARTHRLPCAECSERLKQAVALYRGEFLQHFALGRSEAFEEWLLLKREQLQHQVLDTLSTLLRQAEDQRHFEDMIGYARRMVEIDPLREEAYGYLMRGLAYTGQRLAALTEFENWQRTVRNELGIEPSQDLVILENRIRKEDYTPDYETPPTELHNLPEYLTRFFGREDELNEITAQIGTAQPDSRLLTVVGMGGVGKTRLAVEAARASLNGNPDGIYFVSLAALTRVEQIVPAIAAAMHIAPAGGDLLTTLLSALRTKRILLVLDNVEHLLRDERTNCAALIVKLLETAPHLQVLATSREHLSVRGERAVVVGGMPLTGHTFTEITSAAPIQLFAQGAHFNDPSFKLTPENAQQVMDICRLVHGIPLCLELAAAWVGPFTLNEIAHEIRRNVDFLAYDWQDAPTRHRSVRAVFEWSWQLLDAKEQQVLQQLSVLRGSFSYDAALFISGATRQTLDKLTHKSLLHRSTHHSSISYSLHELLRQLIAEKLESNSEETQHARNRHCEYFLRFVATREQRLARNEPGQVINEIGEFMEDVRAAWDWAIAQTYTQLILPGLYTLSLFFGSIGLLQAGDDFFRLAGDRLSASVADQSLKPSQDRSASMSVEYTLSRLSAVRSAFLFRLGQYDTAITMAQHAVETGRQLNDPPSLAAGYLTLGTTLTQRSQFVEAHAMLNCALQIIEAAKDEPSPSEMLTDSEWNVRIWLRLIAKRRNDLFEAQQQNQLALTLCQRQGRLRGEAVSILYLAGIAAEMGDLDNAHAGYEQALRLAQALGYRWGEGVAKFELGQVVHLQGDATQAIQLMEQALTIFREMGDRLQETRVLAGLIHLHCSDNTIEQCLPYIHAAQEVVRQVDSPEIQSFYKLALARYYRCKGQPTQSIALCRQIVAIDRVSNQSNLARSYMLLGDLYSDLNNVEEATNAYQEARRLHEAMSTGEVNLSVSLQTLQASSRRYTSFG